MNTAIKKAFFLLMLMVIVKAVSGQGMQMGEVIFMTIPVLKKDISNEAFRTFIHEDIVPAWNNRKQEVNFHLFQADRGNSKGEFLVICGLKKVAARNAALPAGNPFSDEVLATRNSTRPSDFLSNPKSFTEYHLVGAKQFKSLPNIGILGIHYIKVKNERAKDFEKFVIEKMHPAVGALLPDMHLLTYKAVDGNQKGTYITIFAIESVAARDQYWPAGKPETERLKQAFHPLQDLARELSAYLVSGSYLEPSGGAAAIFESKEWTDFIHQPVLK